MSKRFARAVDQAMSDQGHDYRRAAAAITELGARVSPTSVRDWVKKDAHPHKSKIPAVAAYLGETTEYVDALLRDEDPPGERDSDIHDKLVLLEKHFGVLTRRQIDQDAEIRQLRQEITDLQAAMVATLKKRL